MRRLFYVLAYGFFLSKIAFALPIVLSSAHLEGDCVHDTLSVLEENGRFYIIASFQNMSAIATNNSIDQRNCLVHYRVKLSPHCQLEAFRFSIKGAYELSDSGSVKVAISHSVDGRVYAGLKIFFDTAFGDPSAANISHGIGSASQERLAEKYRVYGAEIPLSASIHMEAKSLFDEESTTEVSLGEGGTAPYVKLSEVDIRCCAALN